MNLQSNNMNKDQVVIERIYDASPAEVWLALTDVEQMKQWYFPMLESFKPEVGFETEFNVPYEDQNFPHIWKVTESIPNKIIAYDWRFGGYPGNSNLRFTLQPYDDKAKLILSHTGLLSFEPEMHPEFSSANFQAGWEELLESLDNQLRS